MNFHYHISSSKYRFGYFLKFIKKIGQIMGSPKLGEFPNILSRNGKYLAWCGKSLS